MKRYKVPLDQLSPVEPGYGVPVSFAVVCLYKDAAEIERHLRALLSHHFADDCQECAIGQSDEWKAARAYLDSLRQSNNGEGK